jgi:hypothetical protein
MYGKKYRPLSLSVSRALAHARINGYEWMLLHEIIEQEGKAKGPAKVNQMRLAKSWEVDRARLSEAKGALVGRRIILLDPNGLGMRFNPDYHQWVGLSPASVRHADDARNSE